MDRTIFHIDVNSAYLSWSAVRMLSEGYPVDIREIPSVIGGDKETRHGIVLAKSIPAKKYNIKTGEPIASALRKCPDLQIFPPEMHYYHTQSEKFVNVLMKYTSDIEQVSVDECYMEVTGILHEYASPVSLAAKIKNHIRNELGFTVNVGISTNKVLAKMASDFQKPDKIHTLYPEEIKSKIWSLPVGSLFMVGKASEASLHKLGINTIGELADTPVDILRSHLKSHGRMLWEYANGIDNTPINSEPEEQKGIGNSVTLPRDLTEISEINHVLLQLSEEVSERLRKSGQKANMISVEIKYNDFTKTSHQTTLTVPSNSSGELYKISCGLFKHVWNKKPVRLIGIRTSKLVPEDEPEQMSLFDMYDPEKENTRNKMKKLDEAMDRIRSKYGQNAVKRASLLNKENENE